MKYCKKCDRTFNDDFLFCPSCGSRLLSEDEVRALNEQIAKDLAKENEKKVTFEMAKGRAEKALKLQKKYCAEFRQLDKFFGYGEEVSILSDYVLKDIIEGVPAFIKEAEMLNKSERYDIFIEHENMTARKMHDYLIAEYEKREKTLKDLESFFNSVSSSCFNKLAFINFLKAMMFGGRYCQILHIDKRKDKRNFRTDYDYIWHENALFCDLYQVSKYSVIDWRFSTSFSSRVRANVLYDSSDKVGLNYYLYKAELRMMDRWLNILLEYKQRIEREKRRIKPNVNSVLDSIKDDSMCMISESNHHLLELFNEVTKSGSEYYETMEYYLARKRSIDC